MVEMRDTHKILVRNPVFVDLCLDGGDNIKIDV
jgi:hypothetical protein